MLCAEPANFAKNSLAAILGFGSRSVLIHLFLATALSKLPSSPPASSPAVDPCGRAEVARGSVSCFVIVTRLKTTDFKDWDLRDSLARPPHLEDPVSLVAFTSSDARTTGMVLVYKSSLDLFRKPPLPSAGCSSDVVALYEYREQHAFWKVCTVLRHFPFNF